MNQSITPLQKILELITQTLNHGDEGKRLVPSLSPEKLVNAIPLAITNKALPDKERSKLIELVIQQSVHTNHRFFMNQMYGKQQVAGLLGDTLTVLLNTSMYTYEVAPVLTLIEKECIKQLSLKVWKSEEGDGVFTPGSSLANMISMALARHNRFPDGKEKGLSNTPRFSIFASDQLHYSFTKGVSFMGFGTNTLSLVESDQSGRVMPEALKWAIERAKSEGTIPLMLVGIAGTTASGVYDDLVVLGKLAQEHALWFHVDGAYGASLLFSSAEDYKLRGIEMADSVSWSLHKMMGVPLSCAVLLTKEKQILSDYFSVDANYLFHGNPLDLGHKTLQCGRRADALKLWLSWKFEGDQGLEQWVNQLMKLAMRFARIIKASQHLELLTMPESPIICFRYIDHALNNDELNALNKAIRTHIFNHGEILFNYVLHREKIYLRCVLSDPSMTDSELRLIIEEVNKVGYKQSSSLRNSVLDLPYPIGG